jgi:hypothetical protein
MTGERTGSGAGSGAQAATAGWLAGHDQDAPGELRAVVREAVREQGGGGGRSEADNVAGLVAGAVRCLGEALEIGSERAAASPLLAADALLTYAVEAAAESGAPLDRLSADVNGRLAELLGE